MAKGNNPKLYIMQLQNDRDYYKRLAEAAEKYISVKARNEMIIDSGRQLTDAEYDEQCRAFDNYQSIKQERE